MKKFLTLLLSISFILGTLTFTACGPANNSDIPPIGTNSGNSTVKKTYTVTFIQGSQRIEKTVEEGEALTDIPTPKPKTGYNVSWEEVDLSNVTQDIEVNVVEVPKTYTITYDPNGGTVDPKTQQVTYDQEYTLHTPEYNGFRFVCWMYENGAVTSEFWKIDAENITLKAKWEEVQVDIYTVTFLQDGEEPVVIPVEAGQSVPDDKIPQTVPKTGYKVDWADVDLSNITQSIEVRAIEIPKKYTVNLQSGANGSVTEKSVTLTYDADYDLSSYVTPNTGYELDKWSMGNVDVDTKGVWQIDAESITLTANFKGKKYTVTLDVNGGNSLGSQSTMQVTYGATYSLPKPTRNNAVIYGDNHAFFFKHWTYNGQKIDQEGVWKTPSDVTLVADWNEKNLDYTGNY